MAYYKKTFFLSFIIILLFSSFSLAVQESNVSIGAIIFKLILYTFISIIVILITIYGTRFIANSSKKFTNSKYMKVIDSITIGPNIKVIMVEVKETIYVFAITNNSIEVVDKTPKELFYKDFDFEDHLNKHKEKYMDVYINRIQAVIKGAFNRTNTFTDKEEDDDEKIC